jgi:hypothetical protein
VLAHGQQTDRFSRVKNLTVCSGHDIYLHWNIFLWFSWPCSCTERSSYQHSPRLTPCSSAFSKITVFKAAKQIAVLLPHTQKPPLHPIPSQFNPANSKFPSTSILTLSYSLYLWSSKSTIRFRFCEKKSYMHLFPSPFMLLYSYNRTFN